MSFISAVKSIIARFRAIGKSEDEITAIVETAAEKATVNRGCLKQDECPKQKIKVDTNNWRKMHGLVMRRKKHEGQRRNSH